MSPPAPVIDTSDMDPELARYLNRNYWQQKSVELKSSSTASATATQPSAPVIAADTKTSTAGTGGLNNATTGLQQQMINRDDEVSAVMMMMMIFALCGVRLIFTLFECYLVTFIYATFAQLHLAHCRLLNSYKSRITAGMTDICPDCGVAPHFVEHLFQCPACPTQLTKFLCPRND